MAMVSSVDGGSTMMGWNRRSRAASCSMCLRYSSSVVAPMHCNSPRARAGLSMLEASMAPSAAPAPMTVWSSSTKRMIWFFARRISSMMFLRRCSNSPRYFVPATTAARSRVITRLPSRSSGASPEEIRWARPSTMAVFPTPGSPIRTGLFFVRRANIWISRSISIVRPITGSSLPSLAR